MKIKKLLTMIVVMSLLATLACGCAKETPEPETETPTPAPTEATSEETEPESEPEEDLGAHSGEWYDYNTGNLILFIAGEALVFDLENNEFSDVIGVCKYVGDVEGTEGPSGEPCMHEFSVETAENQYAFFYYDGSTGDPEVMYMCEGGTGFFEIGEHLLVELVREDQVGK